MDEIAQQFRYALRWIAYAAGGLLIAAAVLAALVPFLIDGGTVRESFIRNLSAWSGGPVVINGPLRIRNFATLTIEASGVTLADTPRLFPIGRVEAKSVSAIARLSSLLRGKLEFKRVVVTSPRFVFKRDLPLSDRSFDGLGAADIAVGLAYRSPFSDLELRHPAFFIANGRHAGYRRHTLDHIRFGKGPSPLSLATFRPSVSNSENVLVNLSIKDAGFEAHFGGELGRRGETAQGTLRLRASLDNPAAARLTAAMAPWEQSDSVSLAGNLSWSKGRLAFDGTTIAFGDRSAKGSLALAVTRDRALLEGTLAYDSLDLAPAREETGDKAGTFFSRASGVLARLGKDRYLDLDMRISAERFRAGAFETGPLALAFNSRRDRFSVDIADMALFGGSVTGRLDFDPAQPTGLSVSATGTKLDAEALSQALGWPLSLSGPATAQASLTIPGATKPIGRSGVAAAGVFSIDFPAGVTLDGDPSRKLASALARQDLGWGLGASSLSFSAANIDGTIGASGIDLKVRGESVGSHVDGSLRIAFPGALVSGTLSLRPGGETTSASEPKPDKPFSTKVVLSGTLAALVFSSPEKTSLSN
jgi:hypothetical protein